MTDPGTGADLVGAWRLVDWTVTTTDRAGDATVHRPFGDAPTGRLLYTPDGGMLATITTADRAPLGAPLRQVPDDVAAAAARSAFAYGGRFTVDGDTVVHDVETSLWPDMVGTRQVRRIAWEGADLVLTGEEPLPDGRHRTHRLHWTPAR